MQLPNTPYSTKRPLPLSSTLSLGDTLGAVAEETAVTNPASSIGDVLDLQRAREGGFVREDGDIGPSMPGRSPRKEGPATSIISKDEQERRLKEIGLHGQIEPYDGETEEGLNLRIRWRQDELKRQSVMAASERGLGTTLASFATGLGVSALDPLNIASGFVPVVGPAKYASMIKKASGPLERALVRSRVGALEGAVGAGLIEPVVLYGADLRAADYDLYDSLANLVMGSVLGGGLHSAGGALADIGSRQAIKELESVSSDVRREALAAGVAAVAAGRKPIVTESLIKSRLMSSTALGSVSPVPLQPGTRTLGGNAANDPTPPRLGIPSVSQTGTVRRFQTEAEANRAARKMRRDAEVVQTDDGFALRHREGVVDVERNPDGTVNRFKTRREAEKFVRDARDGAQDHRAVPDGNGEFVVLRGADERMAKAVEAAPELADFPDLPRSRFTAPEPVAVTARRAQETPIFGPEIREASARAQERQPPANDDIASLEKEIEDAIAQTELMQDAAPTKVGAEEIASAEEGVSKARERGFGLKRAAACLLSVF